MFLDCCFAVKLCLLLLFAFCVRCSFSVPLIYAYSSLTESEFEDMCHETLESLYDRFEALIDDDFTSTDYDVHLSVSIQNPLFCKLPSV